MVLSILMLLVVAISLGVLLLEVGERLGSGKLRFSKRTPVSLICTLMILYVIISKIFDAMV